MAEFSLTSSAFVAGGAIPRRHACDGEDHSPPLSWSAPPGDARSLALILDDPDAPSGRFICRRGGSAVGGAQRLRHGRLPGAMPAARARTPPLPLPAPCRGPGPAACARRWRGGAGAGPRGQGPCGRGARRDLRTLTRAARGRATPATLSRARLVSVVIWPPDARCRAAAAPRSGSVAGSPLLGSGCRPARVGRRGTRLAEQVGGGHHAHPVEGPQIGRRNTSTVRSCDGNTQTAPVGSGGSSTDAFTWSAAGGAA